MKLFTCGGKYCSASVAITSTAKKSMIFFEKFSYGVGLECNFPKFQPTVRYEVEIGFVRGFEDPVIMKLSGEEEICEKKFQLKIKSPFFS